MLLRKFWLNFWLFKSLVVTRESRIGDRKLVFRFFENVCIKNTANQVTGRNFSAKHVGVVG